MDFKTLPYNDSKYDSIISQKASEELQVKNLSINPEDLGKKIICFLIQCSLEDDLVEGAGEIYEAEINKKDVVSTLLNSDNRTLSNLYLSSSSQIALP